MNSMAPDLEGLRQQLNALLQRTERLNDPEVLMLARQLDRLMVAEMTKPQPPQAPPSTGSIRVKG